ncbi:MAG: AraC family transcriptional regulator [Flavobacteriaceae bacterium]
MFTGNLEKGFGFFTVEEFIKIYGSEEINTSDYFFIICALGEDFHYICGERELIVKHNHALYVAPNKSFTFVNPADNENLVLVFQSDFYERSLLDAQMLNSELFFRSIPYVAEIPIPIKEMREDVSEKINFHIENKTGLEGVVIHNVIEMLITDGLTELKTSPFKSTEDPVSINIMNKFRVLLQKHYKTEKQTVFYAEELNITPKQFARIAEKVTGKKAKQLIIDKTIQESLRLLNHSMLTISEISRELGFENESNFSLFFKKHYGLPPSQYRHNISKNKDMAKDEELN